MSKSTPIRTSRNILSWALTIAMLVLLLLWSLWAYGALWFDFPIATMRPWVAGGFVVIAVVVLFRLKLRWRTMAALAAGNLLVMAWWLTIRPQQNRDWKPEVAQTPYAVVEGDVVTFHQVRNFEYRSDDDFTPNYEIRSLDLRKLRGVDVFLNYWGSPYMAHPILSYDFGEDGRICFSIETRPEKGETYSALGGLYRRFELIYIVADERDVVRLRTNFRKGEDVYLYRLKSDHAKTSFMEYVRTINELHERPRWYNAITNNCTTAIRQQRASERRAAWDWRMLVNGFGDELLYERGAFDRTLPFAELKRVSHINERAQAAGDAEDFSEQIRIGLPGM